jgi:hypothetical protein
MKAGKLLDEVLKYMWFYFTQKQRENYVKQLILEYLENSKNYRQNK